MWKWKKCGNTLFYQATRSQLVIFKADKDGNILESSEGDFTNYGKYHCNKCERTGWKLSQVATWVEEVEE